MSAFPVVLRYWEDRRDKLGDAAVGRKGEDYIKQGDRIQALLGDALSGFFSHGLDFGCGWGRLTPAIAGVCGHVWVADIIDEWVARAASLLPNTTGLRIASENIPLESESMDLVVDIMSLQSIQDDWLHLRMCKELRRVLRPSGRFVSLAKLDDPHRERRIALVGLSDVTDVRSRSVDQAGDEYCLLTGARI